MATFRKQAALALAAVPLGVPLLVVEGDRSLADESITGGVSQSLRASTNPRVETDGGEGSLISTTRLNLGYTSTTPRSTFSADTGVSYSYATGEENDDLTGLFPDLNVGYVYRFDDATLSAGFGVRVEPVTYATFREGLIGGGPGEPVDPGDPLDPDFDPDARFESDSIEIDTRGSLGFSQTIDQNNSYNLSLSARRRSFTENDADLTPNTFIVLGGGWNRTVSPTLSGGLSSSVSYYNADDDENRETYTFGVAGNFSHLASEQLSISGRLGPNVSFTNETDTDTGDRESDVRFSTNLGLNVNYSGIRTGYFAGVSNNVAPSSDGALSNVASVFFGLNHAINTYSTFRFDNRVSFRSALFGADEEDVDDEIFAASSLIYTHELTQTVNATLGYSLDWRDDDGGSGLSHNVFVTLSKSFTLLP